MQLFKSDQSGILHIQTIQLSEDILKLISIKWDTHLYGLRLYLHHLIQIIQMKANSLQLYSSEIIAEHLAYARWCPLNIERMLFKAITKLSQN